MRAEEKHGRIGVEDVLRAVAVVDVPIGDGDALHSVFALRIAGRDRDVVEQAEAHAAMGRGVMAGRTHDAECVLRFALHDEIDGIQAGSGGVQGDFERAGPDIRVAGAERVRAAFHIVAGDPDVLAGVAKREFVFGGGARRDVGQLVRAEAANRRIPARGLLGMPGAGVVLFGDRIGQECGVHVH